MYRYKIDMKVFCLNRYRYRSNILTPGNRYTVKYQNTVKYWYTYQHLLILKKQSNTDSVDYFGLQTGEADKPITLL